MTDTIPKNKRVIYPIDPGGNPGGRPPLYDPDFHPAQAEIMARWIGDNLSQIARAMGVARSTFMTWRARHEEFANALEKGISDHFDPDVRRSLYEKAIGFKTREVKKALDRKTGELRTVEVKEKTLAPDTLACMFILTNKEPEIFKHRQDLTGHQGQYQEIHVHVNVPDPDPLPPELAYRLDAYNKDKPGTGKPEALATGDQEDLVLDTPPKQPTRGPLEAEARDRGDHKRGGGASEEEDPAAR